ncbi:GNAT family N-acetyltransferase [Streptomyces albidochromogenes]|uniref:GNAT family N-acetyltransferase n=1 Tax=Streptomyces albidochromogenes TaxID=329524 RepID=A0ABW6FIK3_9ACTN
MEVRSLGLRTDLMLRKMAGSVITDCGSHVVVRTPGSFDFWWGNFLLVGAAPKWWDLDQWVAAFAAELPEAPHVIVAVDGTDGHVADADGLSRHGLTAHVDRVLTATRLTASRPPVDAVIRPLRGDGDWGEATRLRFGPATSCEPVDPRRMRVAEYRARKLVEYRRMCEAGHGAWFGAFVDGRLASALGLFSEGSGVARFQSVETHPDYCRRGLASALVHHAGTWALNDGDTRALVIVANPDYHAIGIYRALGFTDAQSQIYLSRVAL